MDGLFTGLAALVAALLLGSAASKLHGAQIGDRVFLSLLALPLVPLLFHLGLPCVDWSLKLLPALPIAVYTGLLVATAPSRFNAVMVVAFVLTYAIAGWLIHSTDGLQAIDQGLGGRLTSNCS